MVARRVAVVGKDRLAQQFDRLVHGGGIVAGRQRLREFAHDEGFGPARELQRLAQRGHGFRVLARRLQQVSLSSQK